MMQPIRMRTAIEIRLFTSGMASSSSPVLVLKVPINDIVKIAWLPVKQRKDFHVLKLVHQALCFPSWPSYVPLDTVKHMRSLRSGAATRLTIPMEMGTFQDTAAKLFNVLPANIRNCSYFKVYCREVNAYLLKSLVNSL